MPPERLSRPEWSGFGARASLCFPEPVSQGKKGGFRRKMSDPDRIIVVPYKLLRAWLCWQSAANPSLPANLGNAGRFRKIAGKAPAYCCRKPQHLRALDSPLPTLTSRENRFHSREASGADKVFGTHNVVDFLSFRRTDSRMAYQMAKGHKATWVGCGGRIYSRTYQVDAEAISLGWLRGLATSVICTSTMPSSEAGFRHLARRLDRLTSCPL